MILLKGFIEMGTGQTEAEIRESINELLKQRFPLVRPDHFDFVKRDRNKVTTPVVNESLKWDYKHLKQLCGQGLQGHLRMFEHFQRIHRNDYRFTEH